MKLRDLHQSLSKEEREALAARVGISSGYLWQLATQWKDKRPSLDLLKKLAAADRRLSVSGLVTEFTEGSEAASKGDKPKASDGKVRKVARGH